MNRRILTSLYFLVAILITLPAFAEEFPEKSEDVWRSPSSVTKPVELKRDLIGLGPIMPLYETAIITRLCSSQDYQEQIGKSDIECSRALYKVKYKCTKEYKNKFPRGDNAQVNGRMSYQSFSRSYIRCLKDQYTHRDK